jgi:AraC family transcriptional regulator of arabinose operon
METRSDQRVALAIRAMNERMSEPWRVRDLAALAHLSPSRFAHVFRRTTGVAPLRYLHQLRLQRAEHLLARTSLSVREVTRLIGWTDSSHFSKAFRQHAGTGPREYRRERGTAPTALRDRLACDA